MSITAPSARTAVWAESGQTTEPSEGEQQSGFAAGKPSRRKTNWVLQWLDNAIQWLLGLGLGTYRAGQTYQPGARVVGADGQSYAWADSSPVVGVAPGSGGGSDHWVRWGHMPDQIDDMIDTKLGTISGALAEATITPTGSSVVGYRRQQCFPNSTDKNVCFRLTIPAASYNETITLSGAAAFTTGADGVEVTIADTKGNSATGYTYARGKVLNETQVSIAFYGFNLADSIDLDVKIRGH
jgi:hypothetical protein